MSRLGSTDRSLTELREIPYRSTGGRKLSTRGPSPQLRFFFSLRRRPSALKCVSVGIPREVKLQ